VGYTDWSGSRYIMEKSSCVSGNEPKGSIKMLGNYGAAAYLVGSRAVLSSTEFHSSLATRSNFYLSSNNVEIWQGGLEFDFLVRGKFSLLQQFQACKI
jgi:hypothetical protein